MQDPDGDTKMDNVIRFRGSDRTVEYIDHVQEMWGCSSRSEALRILVHSYIGVLHGDVSGVLDPERLQRRWGDTGTFLAAAMDEQSPTPAGLEGARLGDVLDDVPILLGAARVHGNVYPEGFSEE